MNSSIGKSGRSADIPVRRRSGTSHCIRSSRGSFALGPRCGQQCLRARANAFTLIELILVMAVLTIAVSVTAPALANFFRGRALDSEARRLLSLTRQGHSRAISEGIPMELWLDSASGSYGLEAEPSYEPIDPRKVDFTLDKDLQLEVLERNTAKNGSVGGLGNGMGLAVGAEVASNHPNLPKIRFLPDGTISESSPEKVRVVGRDGIGLWVTQTRSRLSYEIATGNN